MNDRNRRGAQPAGRHAARVAWAVGPLPVVGSYDRGPTARAPTRRITGRATTCTCSIYATTEPIRNVQTSRMTSRRKSLRAASARVAAARRRNRERRDHASHCRAPAQCTSPGEQAYDILWSMTLAAAGSACLRSTDASASGARRSASQDWTDASALGRCSASTTSSERTARCTASDNVFEKGVWSHLLMRS